MKTVYVIGIGMGTAEGMTVAALQAVKTCDVCFGAERMLQVVPDKNKRKITMYRAEEICAYLDVHNDWEQACVLLSGDAGFYSGAKKLLPKLTAYHVELLSGISSLSAFCAKLQIPWEEMAFGSLHGRSWNLIARICRNQYTFVLLGGAQGLKELCEKLCYYALEENVILHVGERLGYPDERILHGTAGQIKDETFDDLLVVIAENKMPVEAFYSEIPDTAFIRGDVPMTKSEVRSLAILKLGLTKASVLYDVGAGTGSVGIQAAVWFPDCQIYAVEQKEEAVHLIERNKQKFCADNVSIIKGRAPEIFADLPASTHAFIGGSTGSLRGIISALWEKNPETVIAAAVVSLETLSEMMQLLQDFGIRNKEIVQVDIAKAREAGTHHLMAGQNPVFIIKMMPEKGMEKHG